MCTISRIILIRMYAYYKIHYWSYVEEKERTHAYIVIVHQDKHLLHTYTFKSALTIISTCTL